MQVSIIIICICTTLLTILHGKMKRDMKHIRLLGNYPNTYVFTKAVAEEVCRIKGSNLPLAIFRPAIVISSLKEPIPGWINNVYGPTGVVAAAAVGLMRVLLTEKNAKANVVPCDFVVNAAIASAWSVGTSRNKEFGNAAANGKATKISNDYSVDGSSANKQSSHDTVVNGEATREFLPNGNTAQEACSKLANGNVTSKNHVAKSVPNGNLSPCNGSASSEHTKKIPVYNFSCDLLRKPFTWAEFMKNNEVFEPEMPSSLSIWTYSLFLCRNKKLYHFYCILLHIFPAFIADNIAKILGKQPKLLDAYSKVHKLGEVLGYFSTKEWKMTNDNVNFLWNRLSETDKQAFNFDMNSIDWKDYFRTHCLGIRQFILKEHPDTIPAALKRRRKLVMAHYTLLSTLTFLSVYLLSNFLRKFVFA